MKYPILIKIPHILACLLHIFSAGLMISISNILNQTNTTINIIMVITSILHIFAMLISQKIDKNEIPVPDPFVSAINNEAVITLPPFEFVNNQNQINQIPETINAPK